MSITLFKVFMAPTVGEKVTETLYSGYVTQGPKVEEFEYYLRQFLDEPYVATVNAGTSGLQLAVYLCGVGCGDLVVSTPMTCTATNTAIKANKADIVWADINPTTGNIDPNSVEKVIKESMLNGRLPKAIMCVDWAGYPCDLADLHSIADAYGIKLIRDAAHSFGAVYPRPKNRLSYADYTVYSFQAIKHLTCVDGGAVVFNDPEDYEKGKLLRWFGIDRNQPRADFRCEANVVEAGFKYHMNDVNATIGIENLKHIEPVISAHKRNGAYYRKSLQEFVYNNTMWLPEYRPDSDHAYWLFTIHVKDRVNFMNYMTANGIKTSQVHSRNDTHTMFDQYCKDLPGVDLFMASQVNLPVGWWLTEEETSKIVQTVIDFVSQ